MNFGMEDRHAPVTLTQYQSDGDTIPYIVGDGEEVVAGDVIDRANGHIGVAMQITDPSCSDQANQKATKDDRIELRVSGLVRMPLAAAQGPLADGARLRWSGTALESNIAGEHELVGSAADGDSHVFARINIYHA